MARGKFITLEGGEGAGKSTQTKNLVAALASIGIKAIATREVGGCPSAEDIRKFWLEKPAGHWDVVTEILLVSAARREHLTRVIWPALEAGTWVVSDRFADSTRAYQGVALGAGVDLVDHVYAAIAPDFKPDLTVLLDLPVETGLHRMAARHGEDDRFQQQKLDFHKTLQRAYHAMVQNEPARFCTVDASPAPDVVTDNLCRVVAERLGVPLVGRKAS